MLVVRLTLIVVLSIFDISIQTDVRLWELYSVNMKASSLEVHSMRQKRTRHNMTTLRGNVEAFINTYVRRAFPWGQFEATSIPHVIQNPGEGKRRRRCSQDSSFQPVSFACAIRLSSCTFSAYQIFQLYLAPIESKQMAILSRSTYRPH